MRLGGGQGRPEDAAELLGSAGAQLCPAASAAGTSLLSHTRERPSQRVGLSLPVGRKNYSDIGSSVWGHSLFFMSLMFLDRKVYFVFHYSLFPWYCCVHS